MALGSRARVFPLENKARETRAKRSGHLTVLFRSILFLEHHASCSSLLSYVLMQKTSEN